MANALAKRLAKIEEMIANRINTPIATVWIDHDFTAEGVELAREAALDKLVADGKIRSDQRELVLIRRWATAEEATDWDAAEIEKSPAGIEDQVINGWRSRRAAGVRVAAPIFDKDFEHGPPDDASDCVHTEKPTDSVTEIAPQPECVRPRTLSKAPAEPDFEAEDRWRKAVDARAREIVQEKLDAAAKAFAKSIV